VTFPSPGLARNSYVINLQNLNLVNVQNNINMFIEIFLEINTVKNNIFLILSHCVKKGMNILMLFKITELKILFNRGNKNKKYILLIGIARKALINENRIIR